jgi:hypothetical protein
MPFSILLPARFRDAGNKTFVRHFTETDAADAEATKHAAGAAADIAASVGAHRELRLAFRFLNQTLFSQKETSS